METSKKSRTYNIIVNSAIGVVASVLQILLNYAVRIIIVQKLGSEINGLHTLFTSILNVMMLMEAGFGTAMVIHLYRPIEEKNEIEIKGIISFYKKIYTFISIGLVLVGVIINFFVIDSLVTSNIALNTVRLYFFLFLFSFAMYYLTYYKRSILFAEQKNRISVLVSLICEIVFRVLQIVVVIKCNSYLAFLTLMILEKLSANIICNIYINKEHPYLKSNKEKISDKNKKSIIDTVKPLVVFNVSSTIQGSSRSILISMLLGNISVVGYYGNYQLVIGAVQLLYSQFGAAFTSSFGNLSVSEDRQKMYNVFKEFSNVLNWITVLLCAGFVTCIQDFILFTFGEEYVLPLIAVLLLTADMFVYLINIPIISIQNSMGLHDKDKYYMVLQAIAVIVLGYILGIKMGMSGILIGAIIPQVIFNLIHKGYIVYEYAFFIDGKRYFGLLLGEFFKSGIIIIICALAVTKIAITSVFLRIVMKIIITVGIVCILFLVECLFKRKYKLLKKF